MEVKEILSKSMDNHQLLVNKLKDKYLRNESVLAMYLTGSVARGDYSQNSDLDLILITKAVPESAFLEFIQDGVVVEVKQDTLDNFVEKLKEKPMGVYQFMEAKVLFDRGGCLERLKEVSEGILRNYVPDDKDKLIKWLSSAKVKILSAREKGDKLLEGYQVSNVLWQLIQALFMVNNMPTPASTTAYRKVLSLTVLPENFETVWGHTLTGDLTTRTESTLQLIDYSLETLGN